MCSGYFRYAEGYAPAFPGAERFAGRIVHPQQWPERHRRRRQARRRHRQRRDRGDAGAGAGAERRAGDDAAALADLDAVAAVRGRPGEVAAPAAAAARGERRHALAAAAPRHVLLQPLPAQARPREAAPARRRPRLDGPRAGARAATSRRATTRGASACAWCPTATCSAPCASGRAAIATGEIESFTPTGVRLVGGEELPADLIVTATGLTLAGLRRRRDQRRRHARSTGRAPSTTRARCSATCPTWSRCSATATPRGR